MKFYQKIWGGSQSLALVHYIWYLSIFRCSYPFEADKNANMVSVFETLGLVIALFAEFGVDGKRH